VFVDLGPPRPRVSNIPLKLDPIFGSDSPEVRLQQ
jgi:hypothetical protein